MNTPIPIRSHTAAVWKQLKPVLAKGEPGRESDTGKIKFGNGFSAWADLPYDMSDRPTPGTPVHGVAATGTLTGTTIGNGNTITIGTVVYTFVTALSDPDVAYEVLIGATDSDSLDNLVACITNNGDAGVHYGVGTVIHPDVDANVGAGDTIDIAANVAGANGNLIATTDTLTAGGFGAATLTGGIDATPAAAGKELYDANFRYLAIANVTISSTTGWMKSAIATL